MSRKRRILIVEDETPIRQGLIDVFVFHGYETDSATTGAEGLEKALRGSFDMILLDVMMPEMDGFTVCNEIRKVSREQPLILLTAKTTEEDILQGLSLGADDYVAKPFSVQELLLRVEAVLRRSHKLEREAKNLQLGEDFGIDCLNLTGQRAGGSLIEFTRREMDILLYLKTHEDRPVSRDELLSEVWGYKQSSRIETRTVDIHIAKLRKKIEIDHKDPRLLVTIRGEGYRLDIE